MGLLIGCPLLIGLLIAYIFFLLSMQKAISMCEPRNRGMAPGLVWLGLIPLFHMIWLFVIVLKVSESLRNEFRSRRLYGAGNCGQSLGLTGCLMYVVSPCCNFAIVRINPDLNFVNLIYGVIVLIVGISYWMQIAGLSRRLASRPAYDDYDDEDDDYDDRPRRRDEDDRDDDRPRRRRDEDDDDDDRPRRRRDEDDRDRDDRDDRDRDDRRPWDRKK